ncbi:MAG TPA: TIGR03667 family PPOX class F420-dependent oxidoreductase [Chloroflexota bacterium]|jgi:PPOX class probable F420-dependent enzyme|nr:TIGR03667 family PPOX class F420-dependent oxidoreductase [Chloroflexota bacterium]
MLNLDSDLGRRAERRLREELVIWLVTAGRDGQPQPSPLWFLWDNGSVLIRSQPDTPKVRNIAANPKVALHFDSDSKGGNVVVLTGTAEVLPEGFSVAQREAYIEKYREDIQDNDMTPDEMLQEYSVTLRVTPTRLRGF